MQNQSTPPSRAADQRVAPQWVTNRTLAMMLFQIRRIERDVRQREAELAELVAGESDPAVLHYRAGQIIGVLEDLDWLGNLSNTISGELDRWRESEQRIGRFTLNGCGCGR